MTATTPPVRNALGFDLEHWYTATLLRDSVTDPVDRVVESTQVVLDLLDRHGVTATFFVVGEVAAEHPDLVARIVAAGHEIGSHGHSHRPVFELTREEFRRELRRSREAIVDAAGVAPAGFRAPNFSITRETAWAFEVLADSRYEYDSSVFPAWTPLYGVRDAPRRPYAVRGDDPFAAADAGNGAPTATDLVELPLSALGSRLRLPIAGGFYARVLPRRLLTAGIARLNRAGVPANLYFHPWEFDPAVRTDDPPLAARLISFAGIDRLPGLLASLLDRFEFGPVGGLHDEYRAAAGAATHTDSPPPT
ncbi:polysaccharide deacetylase family protein [Halobaculum lipolyticum]|uniref:Polysaccharide deacetylase family protein n=1 Tax=Halobaculum lipolyticum TaxID=3032001 RepID=A0ABD5WFN1_9EURY|nr:polysaccharide deacetylase family protein [Halobaculum sp. DT31]